ncbi:MAG: type VI secretion system protein TssA [Myxococcales bacterium]
MPPNDLSTVLEPVSTDAPCGVDLEDGGKYDAAFAEFERLAVGKSEHQIGNTVVPAEDPDWKVLARKSIEILGRSKDLRAGTQLARSLFRTDGWTGFAQGLVMLRGLVERYWEGMYPRLDPDDGNDPRMRISILMNLTDSTMLSAVRTTPVVVSRTVGRFSLKDIEIASSDGAMEGKGGRAPGMASLDAGVMDADLGGLQETASAVRDCLDALIGLEVAVASRVGAAEALSFAQLISILRTAESFLAATLAQRIPAEPGTDARPAVSSGNGFGTAVIGGGGINSRADVVKALEAIVQYYERHEPSSPIPIFMARCKRLVVMSFVDIVRELVPDALTQVDVLRGRVE